MPAWSTEVASCIVSIAASLGRTVDQSRLQRLVYVAHGRCLAATGQPLTGDRPEAWPYGPVYRRLAEGLAGFGDRTIPPNWTVYRHDESIIDQTERALLREIVEFAIDLPLARLSAVTRGDGAPWRSIFADGKGRNADIPHQVIRGQFEEMAWPP